MTADGHATISTEVLCRYAADAARDVPGVRDLVDSNLPHRRGVRVTTDDRGVCVELHVALEWRASAPDVSRGVQRRVREYLTRMAGLEPREVNVVVAEIG